MVDLSWFDKGDDQDLTVYDFDEGEEGGIALVSDTFIITT